MNVERLEKALLELPIEERTLIAHNLLISLEDISEPEFERLWGAKSVRRAAELDSGAVSAIPAEEVARKAGALLR